MDKPTALLTRNRNVFLERRLRIGASFLAFTSLVLTSALHAEPAIPNGYKAERYTRLWQKSPFTVASVVAQPAAETSFADAYTLIGLATAGGKPLVTILDNASQQIQLVTDQPKLEGDIRVVRFINNIDPAKVEVTLQKGPESGILKFNLDITAAAPPVTGQSGSPVPNPANQPRPPNFPAPAAPNISRQLPPIPRPQPPANIIRRPTALPGGERRQRAIQNQGARQPNTAIPAPRPD